MNRQSLLNILSFVFIFLHYGCGETDSIVPDPKPEIVDSNGALPCNYFTQDRVLEDDTTKAVDYYIKCNMQITAKVVVKPGVTIKFADNSSIEVTQSGSLNCTGTSQKRITLTAENEVSGAWKGLIFFSNSTQNKLHYTNLEYAGGGSFTTNQDKGAVVVWSEAKINLDSLIISKSGSHGLRANYLNSDITMLRSTFSECALAPISINQSYLASVQVSNIFENNKNNFVEVNCQSGAVPANTYLPPVVIPFRIVGTRDLQITQGTFYITSDNIVEFEDGVGIFVGQNGALKVSTDGNGTLFTGVNKVAGAWSGIFYQFTQKDNTLDDLTIEYAGAKSDNNNAAIQMWANPKLAISNITFKEIKGCALMDRPKGENEEPNPNLTNRNNHTYKNVTSEYCKS